MGCVVLALSLVVTSHQGLRCWQHFKANSALTAENVRLQRLIEEAEPFASETETPASKEATAGAARALDRLNAPWDALFEDVESVMNGDVALLSLEPDLTLREIRFRGEARHVEAMLQFVRRIDETVALSNPHLESYQFRLQDPQQPVRFSLVARWMISP